jgi:uncharacterized peroxidase-related enzyme
MTRGTRDDERRQRSLEEPLVGGLPDVPGILTAIQLTPGLGIHLRGLADELLVHDFPGATIGRHEREMLAMAVSARNDCFYCMDSHGAFAAAVGVRNGLPDLEPLLEGIKGGSLDGTSAKMRALLRIADVVRSEPRSLSGEDVTNALDAGASDGDVQLAVLISAAFSMYNRIVEGFRARTPPDPAAFHERAGQIAEAGYSSPPGRGTVVAR